MDPLIATLADVEKEELIFIVGGVIAVIAILSGTLCSITKTRSKERSRREIAAYIAEGSMSPEDGERLMNAASDED